ncbi:helix-turn-helix domain-containing protein [Bifidobacterium sp. A11]|uniref:helix-turn-helix domain-containing protein n=1 Tax=Bifidobacterium sp. A11 TaxID=1394176 RepID=UPI00209E4D76|nr:helix-turn-helix transcriptional regulator [Bifidobacterium sp. A11]
MKKLDTFTDQVIKTIESTRQEVGMTTQELIRRSGIRRSTFFRKMRGDTSFTTEDIDALAKAMGVDPFLILSNAAERADAAKRTDMDLSQLPEDEKVAYVLDKIKAGDQTLAAMNDPNKEKEAEGGDGR